jgi:hypothetical protein
MFLNIGITETKVNLIPKTQFSYQRTNKDSKESARNR